MSCKQCRERKRHAQSLGSDPNARLRSGRAFGATGVGDRLLGVDGRSVLEAQRVVRLVRDCLLDPDARRATEVAALPITIPTCNSVGA
jgi:hypothetical protein